MRTLNLGILAHVDAGKTSLTERLLYAAGVIDEIGSVDDGSTQTDSLALERRRGITIKSAVVSFVVGDVTVNLIDTPGHPDFIAEVERVLSVLDGAVLVVSAVEGVQAQTRVLMRALQRLRDPDAHLRQQDRPRAARGDDARAARRSPRSCSPAIVADGRRHGGLGTRDAAFTPYGAADAASRALVDVLADHDDALLAAYVDDEARGLVRAGCARELAAQTARALVHPVFFGSAITGAGVDALTAGVAELLPAAAGDADGPAAGTVFKIERGPAGEKIAYVRHVRRARCATRDRAAAPRRRRGEGHRDRACSTAAPPCRARRSPPGRSAKLWGLGDVRIGDPIGAASGRPPSAPLRAADARDGRRPPPRGATAARCTPRSPSSPSRTR